MPYYPLAHGLLTGKYRRGAPPPAGSRLGETGRWSRNRLTDANFDIVDKLEAFVSARGRSLLELAFSWLAVKPCVPSVIAGATRPEQVAQNARAAEWKFSAEELAEIDAITRRED